MATIHQVKDYWEKNPLLSYEIAEVGSDKYFDDFDAIKRNDSDKYAMQYWQFDKFVNKKILDVGCGPGWLTVNYAKHGGLVQSIDLTNAAVELTKKHLRYRGVEAAVAQGNAEELNFEDNYFDLVVSSGVLHHTPDTPKAIRECFRVAKKGGLAKLTFYYKGLLHNPCVFKLTTGIMKIGGVKHPGANLAYAKDVDDFIRQYDGRDNPVGIGKSKKGWDAVLKAAGFKILDAQLHFFPVRFITRGGRMPDFVHRFLDRYLGTMIYYDLLKP